jgi:sialate O-acetylesterase
LLNRSFHFVVLVTFCAALSSVAHAKVALPSLFSDGMVLQRDMPIHVWGKAEPDEKVTVAFRGETKSAVTDSLGYWNVDLSPGKEGGPFELSVRGANEITIRDVLVGDVWIASGQSNMEFAMRQLERADAEIGAANVPDIRLLRVTKASSEFPLYDAGIDAAWAKCSPTSVREFSAVAYYFAREIYEREHVPVGVIESSWGGTVAEAWTSMDALTADAALMPVFAARAHMLDDEVDGPMIEANQKRAQEQARGQGKPAPEFPWRPLQQMWRPAGLYNAMIAPLTRYTIRGVIWYQGESNSRLDRAFMYERLFQTMIRDWRDRWNEGDFPFLFVQISNFKSNASEDWPTIREAQRRALSLRNTAMAVTIDIGNPDDVHPTNKRDVGHRLALAARATVYGERIEYSGPLYRQVTREQNALRVWFDHAVGLRAPEPAAEAAKRTGPPPVDVIAAAKVVGFEIAGDDGRFVPAEGFVDGSTVIVKSSAVEAPVSVRYGWANSPTCNLQNRIGLPASPFRASLQ